MDKMYQKLMYKVFPIFYLTPPSHFDITSTKHRNIARTGINEAVKLGWLGTKAFCDKISRDLDYVGRTGLIDAYGGVDSE